MLTTQEEVGLLGVRKAFDATRLQARVGFVYDHAAPIGGIVDAGAEPVQAVNADVHRRAPRTPASQPEHGRSADRWRPPARSPDALGRLDEGTTANVGMIEGGTARNVVPDRCTVVAEVRSLDPARARTSCRRARRDLAGGPASECTAETRIVHEYEAYRLPPHRSRSCSSPGPR